MMSIYKSRRMATLNTVMVTEKPRDRCRRNSDTSYQSQRLTSSPGAECAITVASLDAGANNLTINVLSVVDVDVAGAAAAVRNLVRHSCRTDAIRNSKIRWMRVPSAQKRTSLVV